MRAGLLVVAAVALATGAGCSEGVQIENPSAEVLKQAEAGCVEVVGNEYEEAQRPPVLDFNSTSYADGVITLTGIARGKTTSPVPYRFACRHSGGATVLASLDLAEDIPVTTTSETVPPEIEEFANSLTDEQYAILDHGLRSRTAELACQAAAGMEYVPADQKPFRAEMLPTTPFRGGFLVSGEIQGSNGLVATVRCRIDAEGDAEVTDFEVTN